MYETLVNFIGAVPDGCEPIVYMGCIVFTLYLIDESYSLVRYCLFHVFDRRK